jgi:hypothetical protein
MKNVVLWNMKTQFPSHRKHITYPLHGTAVTIKNVDFWDVMICCSYNNRRFGGMYRLHHEGARIGELGPLLVTRHTSVASYC